MDEVLDSIPAPDEEALALFLGAKLTKNQYRQRC